VGTGELQEKAGKAKDKLDGHHRTRSDEHGHYLERSRKTGGRQSRITSTCGSTYPPGCG